MPSVDLHGNLSQTARDRNLAAFTTGDARVLVATDIAARGVHVDEVELVVHVDPPMEHKAYLHRSGRTARAGSSGDVVTVVLPEQRRDTHALMRKAGINVRPQEVVADSAPVTHWSARSHRTRRPRALRTGPRTQPPRIRRAPPVADVVALMPAERRTVSASQPGRPQTHSLRLSRPPTPRLTGLSLT